MPYILLNTANTEMDIITCTIIDVYATPYAPNIGIIKKFRHTCNMNPHPEIIILCFIFPIAERIFAVVDLNTVSIKQLIISTLINGITL